MKQYYTQMEAAKKGIITPEMEIVAKKEYMDPEKLRGHRRGTAHEDQCQSRYLRRCEKL